MPVRVPAKSLPSYTLLLLRFQLRAVFQQRDAAKRELFDKSAALDVQRLRSDDDDVNDDDYIDEEGDDYDYDSGSSSDGDGRQ